MFRKTNKTQPKILKNTTGSLVIPEHAEITYLEPAIEYEVIDNAYFFLKLPNYPKKEYLESHEKFEVDEIGQVTLYIKNPSTNEFFQEVIPTHKDKLTPGTKVLARPFEINKVKHEFLMEVIEFEKEEEANLERPDLGHKTKIIRKGYMYASDLKPIEKFEMINGPIFPQLPETKQVIQAQMGDCFLLATINAILNSGDYFSHEVDVIEFVKGMMKQLDDGTTIVRLFDPREIPPSPVYIRVDTSLHAKDSNLKVFHKAPWVHILEKAYAGLGLYMKNNNVSLGESSFLSTYGEGGLPGFAYQVLTGCEAHIVKTPDHTLINFNTIINSLEEIQEMFNGQDDFILKIIEEHHFDISAESTLTLQEFHNLLLGEVFNYLENYEKELQQLSIYSALDNDINILKLWCAYVLTLNKLKSVESKFLMEYMSSYSIFAMNASELFSEANPSAALLNLLLEGNQLLIKPPANVADAMATAINKPIHIMKLKKDTKQLMEDQLQLENIHSQREIALDMDFSIYVINGPAFSGRYTKEVINYYNMLLEKLKSGHIITTQTHLEEAKVLNGLLARHAYSVTDIYSKIILNDEDEPTQTLWIKLRNPWGEKSLVGGILTSLESLRAGQENAQMAYHAHEGPESEIDFITFIQNFSRCYIGDPLPKLIEAQKINALNEAKKLNYPYSMLTSDTQRAIQIYHVIALNESEQLNYIRRNVEKIDEISFGVENFILEHLNKIYAGNIGFLQSVLFTKEQDYVLKLSKFLQRIAEVNDHPNAIVNFSSVQCKNIFAKLKVSGLYQPNSVMLQEFSPNELAFAVRRHLLTWCAWHGIAEKDLVEPVFQSSTYKRNELHHAIGAAFKAFKVLNLMDAYPNVVFDTTDWLNIIYQLQSNSFKDIHVIKAHYKILRQECVENIEKLPAEARDLLLSNVYACDAIMFNKIYHIEYKNFLRQDLPLYDKEIHLKTHLFHLVKEIEQELTSYTYSKSMLLEMLDKTQDMIQSFDDVMIQENPSREEIKHLQEKLGTFKEFIDQSARIIKERAPSRLNQARSSFIKLFTTLPASIDPINSPQSPIERIANVHATLENVLRLELRKQPVIPRA